MNSENYDAALFDIDPPSPPNDGILFVDHFKAGRSGRLGYALVELLSLRDATNTKGAPVSNNWYICSTLSPSH
jgi:hypothetical protein